MKYGKLSVVALLLGITAPVHAGVDVRIGVPLPVVVAPAPVVVAPPPVVVAPPPFVAEPSVQVNIDAPAPLVLAAPPQLIFSPALGFYVAVGIPQEIVLVDNVYYLHRHGRWFRSDRYNGNWVFVERGRLPHGLRNHDWKQIRHHRDREYRNYRRDPKHYRGKFYEHGGGHHPGGHRPGAGPAHGNKHAPHAGPGKDHEGGRHEGGHNR